MHVSALLSGADQQKRNEINSAFLDGTKAASSQHCVCNQPLPSRECKELWRNDNDTARARKHHRLSCPGHPAALPSPVISQSSAAERLHTSSSDASRTQDFVNPDTLKPGPQTPKVRAPDVNRSRTQILAAQLRRKRRESANYRERRRMRRLNEAFDLLRQRLPSSAALPLSKQETLQMAVEYIMALKDLLS